jgi:preprotein translocase subunit Sec63
MRYFTLIVVLTYLIPNSSQISWENIEKDLQNPYRILRIAPWASKAEIKAAYNDLARKLHPDRNNMTDNDQGFIQVQDAYERLRSMDTDEEYKFFNLITKVITYVLALTATMIVLFYIFKLGLFLFKNAWRYIYSVLLNMIIFELVFPHYFESFGSVIFLSNLISFVFLNLDWLRDWVFEKEKAERLS